MRRGGPLPKAIDRSVRLRDRHTCRVPGCHRRRYVDVHHLHFQSEDGEHSRNNCVCLCTTHHTLLHEGHLRIEGDADLEGALKFYGATGAPLSAPGASQRGTAATNGASQRGTAATSGASQRGTAGEAGGSPRALVGAVGVGQEAAKLLALMGGRGGWSLDAPVDASGLRVGVVQGALLGLELAGCVSFDTFGAYTPSIAA